MLFPDYTQTGVVYHVIDINDFYTVKSKGIEYHDKRTYKDRYLDFHRLIDSYKTGNIPRWVDRSRAIFASMNFARDHRWHSHSMLLAVRVDPSRCWVANENRANVLYEPFILQNQEEFRQAALFMLCRGKEIVKEYWETSLSFEDNLVERRDRQPGYDAEVMVFHAVKPEDIRYVAVVSDHRMMPIEQWKQVFCGM